MKLPRVVPAPVRAVAAGAIFALASAVVPAQSPDYTEFVWTEAPFPSAHASTIVEADDGTLLSAWFGGADEGNPDVGIWSARKAPGGEWTPPVEVYKEPKQPAWNPVLYRDSQNVVWLYFKIGPSPQNWTGAFVKSTDRGASWSPIEWMPSGLLGPIRNKPILLSNGDILSGTSFESYESWATWMEISSDGMKTWTKHGPLLFGDAELDRKGTIQPTLLEVEPGVVRALMRTRRMTRVGAATSTDYGRTWSKIELTDLPHPGAGIDAVRLKDGRCVLIYNPVERGRNPLSVAVSHDGAKTWERWIDLDRLEPGVMGELSYPNVIQAEDGDVHVVYTWRRMRIKHAEIPLADIPKR